MKNLLADISVGELRGLGRFGLIGDSSGLGGLLVFPDFLSLIVGVMTIVAIIWFVIQFFIGAIGIIGSGGDKGKLTESRTKITTSLTGLVVVIAATVLIRIIGYLLGIQSILDIYQYILCLGPGGVCP